VAIAYAKAETISSPRETACGPSHSLDLFISAHTGLALVACRQQTRSHSHHFLQLTQRIVAAMFVMQAQSLAAQVRDDAAGRIGMKKRFLIAGRHGLASRMAAV
jgi:hypothetical protein